MKLVSTLDLNNNRAVNGAAPQAGTDLVTRQYVDDRVTGLVWKSSVRVTTTAALPANTRAGNVLTASANGALAAIDGVALAVGDRVLVKNEAAAANNGIYTVTALGGAGAPWTLTRAADADTDAEVLNNMAVFVQEGTTLHDTGWTLSTDGPIVVNTTALAFTQFTGGSAYTAGNGIALNGNAFSVNPAGGGGISVGAGGVSVDPTVVARKFTALIGNAAATSIAVAHNLNNQYVHVQVFDAATNAQVFADVVLTDANTVTITFSTAPAANAYRVVVIG